MSKAETGTLDEPNEAPLDTTPAAQPDASAAPASEQQDDKPGRTAGRARAPDGKLLPGKAVREPAPQPSAAAPLDKSASPPPALAPAAAPVTQRPSTWKKELDPHWLTLAPEVQAEILRREGDYAKGVSTYKTEYDRLRPFDDAVQPYLPVMQQYGIDPAKHVGELLKTHHDLVTGTPEQKVARLAQIAAAYQIPLGGLFVHGQDGQLQFNQQLLNQRPAPQPARQQQQQPDYRSEIRAALVEERAQTELQAFEAAKEKYPHYEQVKATMAGLLQSGLADDLQSAYDAALRHPRHADLYAAQQEQQRSQEAARQAKEKADLAAKARANALSPRSAAPTGPNAGAHAKGLRGALEQAFDEHATGRV